MPGRFRIFVCFFVSGGRRGKACSYYRLWNDKLMNDVNVVFSRLLKLSQSFHCAQRRTWATQGTTKSKRKQIYDLLITLASTGTRVEVCVLSTGLHHISSVAADRSCTIACNYCRLRSFGRFASSPVRQSQRTGSFVEAFAYFDTLHTGKAAAGK